jgi:Zn-dependent protease with chaperone function
VNAVAFLVALGAIAFPLAWLVAAATLVAVPVVRRFSPVARAEATLALALLPATAALVVGLAVTAPALSTDRDHCLGHDDHHPHVCPWHGASLTPLTAGLGVVGWTIASAGLARVTARLFRAERLAAGLAAVGRRRGGVYVVNTGRAICHTVGVVRPRVVVSRAVVEHLDGDALRAVLAHERAHVHRADPRWSALLAVAGCAAPLTSGVWGRIWRDAVEEAADDAAASVTDGPTVAGALVAVSRLGVASNSGLAFGAGALERRVVRLLQGAPAPRRSRASELTWTLGLAAAAVVVVAHDPVHHLVEESWEIASR